MLSLEVRKHQINLDKVVETSVKVIPNIATIFLLLSEIETVSNKIAYIILSLFFRMQTDTRSVASCAGDNGLLPFQDRVFSDEIHNLLAGAEHILLRRHGC